MRHHYLSLSAFIMVLGYSNAFAQVEELSNTEMTEAYILDGSIIVKQKPAPRPSDTSPVKIKLGPGTPVVSEAQTTQELDQQANQQLIFDQEFTQRQGAQQLQHLEQSNDSTLTLAAPLSPAAQAQQAYAQNLVREGLGLPDSTQITPEIMGQYLSTFAGQSSGDPLQAQQALTSTGFQFIIPNNGGQIHSGIYSSGDGSMNVESNNSQIIFNLLFPKNP